MTPEELVAFRENVANPRMRDIIKKTVIPENTCYITELSISFLDGRSCGHDNNIVLSGLLYKDGKVEEYHYKQMDIDMADFVNNHKNCRVMSDAKLFIFDELAEMEISTVMSSFRSLTKLFPELEHLCAIPMELVSFEWNKIKYLFENATHKEGLKTIKHIKEWYRETYPDDKIGNSLDGFITFSQLYKELERGTDVYECLGCTDSLVRERVFEELARHFDMSYDTIYNLWVDGANNDNIEISPEKKPRIDVLIRSGEEIALTNKVQPEIQNANIKEDKER